MGAGLPSDPLPGVPEMPYRLDPARLDLAREFKARPYGRHSAELQRVLNLFRGGAIAGNWCLVCRRPHREWILARFGPSARDPVDILGPSFASMEEAEWHVFKLRWRQFAGTDPAVD
jgi:N,N-dimethylformamidase